LLLVPAVLYLSGCTKSSATGTTATYITATNLFPLNVGNAWTYSEYDLNSSGLPTGQPRKVVSQVVGTTTMDGYTGVYLVSDSIFYSADSITVDTTYFRVVSKNHLQLKIAISAAGFSFPAMWGDFVNGDIPLNTNFKIKDTTVTFLGSPVQLSVNGIVQGPDSVQLQNGTTYPSAYKLTTNITLGTAGKVVFTTYFVDGVGPVKLVEQIYINSGLFGGYDRELRSTNF